MMFELKLVVAAIFSFVVYVGFKLARSFRVPEELKDVPCVSFIAFIRSFLADESFEVRYNKLMKAKVDEFGYARMWTQGKWEVILSQTHHIKEVLANSDSFAKKCPDDLKTNMLQYQFLGFSNIVMSDGDEWKRHRRVAKPAFAKNFSVELFGDCALELIDQIENQNGLVHVHDLFQRLTLDVLGKGMFSYDFKAQLHSNVNKHIQEYNDVMDEIIHPLYFFIPELEDLIPSRKTIHKTSAHFRRFLRSILDERLALFRSGKECPDDLLTGMVKASQGESDLPMSDVEIVNNLAAFFVAGHDTTANTLTSVLYFLSKHQNIQDKARQEVLSFYNHDGIPTLEEQKDLPYITMIIKEALRMFPTVGMIRRYCNKRTVLSDGTVVPSDCFVSLQVFDAHRNPEIFPEPHEFIPERFQDPHGVQANSIFPFGGGSRLCLGISFSLMEQRIVLSMLLRKYSFHLGPNSVKQKKMHLGATGLIFPRDLDIKFVKR